MTRTLKVTHMGKVIYCMDFSHLKNTGEIKNIMNESAAYIRSQPPNSVLTFTDITGMHFSSEIKDLFSTFLNGNKPYVKAGAVIGLSGLQQIVYNAVMKLTGRDIKTFTTEISAKNWLASKD
ncbi:MAG TPA: STAS/SEC14 domain-containing protein [Bacteroidales bacterium]|nr:STAS/SEC14 domain-containing protein [Bacteroidales bacterium]